MSPFAVAVSLLLAQAPTAPDNPYRSDLPYTLTVYAIEHGRSIGQEAEEYPVPVDSLAACMGAGTMAVVAQWVSEHPKKIVVRTTCRVGAPATERPA